MAAYAAVISVMNNIEQIQNHSYHSFSFDKKQMEHVHENVCFLLDFLEFYPHGRSKEAEALESLIASAAQEADDVIESHVVDQIQAGITLNGNTSPCFLTDLQKVIENLDSVKEMVVKAKAEGNHNMHTYSTPPAAAGKNAMVGFNDELTHLLDVLTEAQSSLQIISITGMGGIGKTTIAKHVYEHSIIHHHFDICVWATVSQDFSKRKILSELLSCLGKSTTEFDKKTEYELGELLRQKVLWNRRYLVVLDDIWSKEALDDVKDFFPNNQNGSRVVVTSRQSDVANHLGSLCLSKKFLDEEKSWNLFCEKAFEEQGCPPELEETGKNIVEKCGGLPLLIVTIGGHLRKSPQVKEYWVNVARDITSLVSGEEEQWFDVLCLSYNYLPAHLKPCFLYFGIFPEDEVIHVPTLVKLWVAEGFLKPSQNETLEEVAEGCLKDLVDRNLILVRKWEWNGKIRTCSIHDLLRELCMKIASENNFFYIVKKSVDASQLIKQYRLVVDGSIDESEGMLDALKSAALTRTLMCKGGELPSEYRLLKVSNPIKAVINEVDEILSEIHNQQVNLRYLCSSANLELTAKPLRLTCSISLLWNLQTLIIPRVSTSEIVAPCEIWKMQQLRHVMVTDICLPDPPLSDQQKDLLALKNLQTLCTVKNLRLSEDVCEKIPFIKELKLRYEDSSLGDYQSRSDYHPNNLVRFQKLESLSCFFKESQDWRSFAVSFAFPSSLHKLCLYDCLLKWEDLSMIGGLPHLQVLELRSNSVMGPQWNPVDGEFLQLKSLTISYCRLTHWNAESSHFPVLEELVLISPNELDEIPLGIGDIPTLEFVSLRNCSVLAAISAIRILVQQESLGNEGLQLEVVFWKKVDGERFKEIFQAEGLSNNNLRLECHNYYYEADPSSSSCSIS